MVVTLMPNILLIGYAGFLVAAGGIQSRFARPARRSIGSTAREGALASIVAYCPPLARYCGTV